MQKQLAAFLAFVLFLGAGCPTEEIDTSIDAAPMSGTWSFNMQADAAFLSGPRCPSGSAGLLSSGSAELSVSETAETIGMSIDNQNLVYHRQSSVGYSYRTGTRMFTVRGTGPGTVYFDMTANTPDTIVGAIHWNNNDGCAGDYPFTMELIEPELPGEPDTSPYTLSAGQWRLDVDDIQDDCWGSQVAGFTGLPDTIVLEPIMDLDTGSPSPSEFYADPLGATFGQLPGTNVYAQTGTPFDLGAPVDEAGDVLLDFENQSFEGTLEIQAGANGTATAQLYASGDSCGAMLSLSLTLQ